jgi:hypothetical protein
MGTWKMYLTFSTRTIFQINQMKIQYKLLWKFSSKACQIIFRRKQSMLFIFFLQKSYSRNKMTVNKSKLKKRQILWKFVMISTEGVISSTLYKTTPFENCHLTALTAVGVTKFWVESLRRQHDSHRPISSAPKPEENPTNCRQIGLLSAKIDGQRFRLSTTRHAPFCTTNKGGGARPMNFLPIVVHSHVTGGFWIVS